MTLLNWDIFYNSLLFSFIMTVSPGLNNILTILFTLHHNVKKALIFRLGVIVSFPLMGALGVLILRPVIDSFHSLIPFFNLFGSSLLMYVGIKIFTNIPNLNVKIKYIGFFGAFALQLINGKAWSMVIGITSVYTSNTIPLLEQATAVYLSLFVAVVIASVPWIVFAHIFKEKLSNPSRLRMVNLVLGGFIILMTIKPLYESSINVFNFIFG